MVLNTGNLLVSHLVPKCGIGPGTMDIQIYCKFFASIATVENRLMEECVRMKGNDLSNKISPRHVIVFEGGLAHLPIERLKEYQKAYDRKRYWDAIAYWVWNPLMLAQIERVVRTMDINVEVCTWIGSDLEYHDFALAIADELDRINIPIRSVWASEPDELAKALPYLPDIAFVYDPDPKHVLTYGSRGVLLTNPAQIGRGR